MTALDGREAGAFWRELGPAWERAFGRPRAVLAISAHSLTREPVLLAAAHQTTVHDFSGFPQALYELRYDTPGAPDLAQEVAGLLQAAGCPVHVLDEGGLDHGVWTPLRSMFPEADIPVLPLAWPPNWAPERLLELGRALEPLTRQGVMVMGSGAITHNLRLWGGGRDPIDAPERSESAAFRTWMAEHAASADWPALTDWLKQAPHARFMHPSDEHLLPFFVAAGAAATDAQPSPVGTQLHASVTFGHLAMDSYAFGAEATALQAALAGPAG